MRLSREVEHCIGSELAQDFQNVVRVAKVDLFKPVPTADSQVVVGLFVACIAQLVDIENVVALIPL